MTNHEPSCEHNHDAMRRELRDKDLPPTPCPSCSWLLKPARAKVRLLSDDIQEFIDWMEINTDFSEWNEQTKHNVQMELIRILTEP